MHYTELRSIIKEYITDYSDPDFMDQWFHDCGTPSCLGGWAYYLATGDDLEVLARDDDHHILMSKELNLDYNAFHDPTWEEDLKEQYSLLSDYSSEYLLEAIGELIEAVYARYGLENEQHTTGNSSNN